jgi:GntR family transcriptional regulator
MPALPNALPSTLPSAFPSALSSADFAATAAGGEVAPAFSPLYQQIKSRLLRSLQAGEWKPGEAIPSEMDLAARFKVSQGTVRKAIDELAQENHLVRRQGKGTFVATHAEERTQYRFLRLVPDESSGGGGSLGRLQRRLLSCRRMRAPTEVARALELQAGENAVQVRRLLLSAGNADAEPVVLDELWLPGSLFKDLSADKLVGWRGPMYGLFEAEFGVRMVRAEERIRAVAAAPEDATLLAVPPGAPLLQVERLSFTYDDRPVELRRGLYRTERFHYRNQLV